MPIPKIQSTELKKINKLKGPSEDASVLLGREKKPSTRGIGGTWERKKMGECGDGNMVRYWVGEKD